MIAFARRRHRAIDLRFDQDVIGAADHHQMLDIVPPNEHQLALPVQAEGVHQPEPGLARTAARNPEAMGEHEPVNDRQHNQRRNSAGDQHRDLEGLVVAEGEEVTEPLHAKSNACAAGRRWPSKPASAPARPAALPRRPQKQSAH